MCWVSFMQGYSDLEKNTFGVKLIMINIYFDMKYDVIFTSGERVVGADCFGETCPVRKVARRQAAQGENFHLIHIFFVFVFVFVFVLLLVFVFVLLLLLGKLHGGRRHKERTLISSTFSLSLSLSLSLCLSLSLSLSLSCCCC